MTALNEEDQMRMAHASELCAEAAQHFKEGEITKAVEAVTTVYLMTAQQPGMRPPAWLPQSETEQPER